MVNNLVPKVPDMFTDSIYRFNKATIRISECNWNNITLFNKFNYRRNYKYHLNKKW